jgi:hypothetical protein
MHQSSDRSVNKDVRLKIGETSGLLTPGVLP